MMAFLLDLDMTFFKSELNGHLQPAHNAHSTK